MSLAAQKQASMFYARKRRRSLMAVPRLFKTHFLVQGDSQSDPFVLEMLTSAITFKTKVDLSTTPGALFSVGTNLVATRPSASQLTINLRGKLVADLVTPTQGNWDLVFSVKPGSDETRTWNQHGLLSSISADPLPNDRFVELTDSLQANTVLAEPLSIYALQIPRHFVIKRDVIPATEDELLLNSTAFYFMTDFPTPFLEG